MGNWSKIIYDKMPVFWTNNSCGSCTGQICMKEYIPDPAISFVAMDAYTGTRYLL
jgi:hypothetical protein